jgi:hypothetical protein
MNLWPRHPHNSYFAVAMQYKWLSFLSKVAFICNLLFLLCFVILYTHNFITNKNLQSFIIILGWFVSFFINLIVNITELLLLFNRKISPVKNWLRTFNFVIFIIQVIDYFFLK